MTQTPRIEITLSLGLFKKHAGTQDRRAIAGMKAMLRAFDHQPERTELLRDLYDGRRKLLKVYELYVAGRLSELPVLDAGGSLEPAVTDWLAKKLPGDISDAHRASLRYSFDCLLALLRRRATIGDLPRLVRLYRQETADRPRTFNLARAAAQAFLRDGFGRHHRLWTEVSNVPPMRERKRGRQGFAVAEAVAIRDQLSPAAGRAWWSMCLTGMGPAELWEEHGARWTVRDDRVHVAGTKRAGRVRDVPLVDVPVRPEITRAGLKSALDRLEEKVSPYQARKTFARMLEEARIPRTRREIYQGHGRRDINDIYERYEVAEYLRDDARRLRELLGTSGLRLMGRGE